MRGLRSLVFASFLCFANVVNGQVDTSQIDIYNMSFEQLMQVEISIAGNKEEKIQNIPSSIVLISRTDIERNGFRTLDEILVNVPGLFGIDQRDVSGLTFGVRGFWSAWQTSIVFFINGTRCERIGNDGQVYSLPYIPVESIERIEIIRGPMSLIYGTGAFFGAINIITNNASNTNDAVILAGYGSQNSYKAGLHFSVRNSRTFKYTINAGYYNTDGPNFQHKKMTTRDLSALTSSSDTKNKWGEQSKFFNISTEGKGLYSDVTLTNKKKGVYQVFPAATDGAVAYSAYSIFSLGYRKAVSNKISFDSKLTYHNGLTKTDWDFQTPPNALIIGGDNVYREDYELDLGAFYSPSSHLFITSGLFYKKVIKEELQTYIPRPSIEYREGLLNPIEYRAFYAQFELKPNEKLQFFAGFRLEQVPEFSAYYRDLTQTPIGNDDFPGNERTFDHDAVEFIPRLAAIFNINDNNTVKAMYGKAVNFPNFNQIAGQAASGYPALGLESIQTFEVNYIGTLLSKISLNTSMFYNNFNNLIVSRAYFDDQGNWIGKNVNEGRLITHGVEITVITKPINSITFELSGIFQQTQSKQAGLSDSKVAYSPDVLGYFKASYSFNKNISFTFTGRYVDEMVTISESENVQGTELRRYADGVKRYAVFDVNVLYNNILQKRYFLQLKCSNVFDKEYLYPVYSTNFWANKGVLGDGRLIMLTIGKRLNL